MNGIHVWNHAMIETDQGVLGLNDYSHLLWPGQVRCTQSWPCSGERWDQTWTLWSAQMEWKSHLHHHQGSYQSQWIERRRRCELFFLCYLYQIFYAGKKNAWCLQADSPRFSFRVCTAPPQENFNKRSFLKMVMKWNLLAFQTLPSWSADTIP